MLGEWQPECLDLSEEKEEREGGEGGREGGGKEGGERERGLLHCKTTDFLINSGVDPILLYSYDSTL